MARNTLHNALSITLNLFKNLRLRIAVVRSAWRQPNISKHTSLVSCDLVLKIFLIRYKVYKPFEKCQRLLATFVIFHNKRVYWLLLFFGRLRHLWPRHWLTPKSADGKQVKLLIAMTAFFRLVYTSHLSSCIRVVHGSILCDPIQTKPSADWLNPTQPITSGKIWTQPDPTQYN